MFLHAVARLGVWLGNRPRPPGTPEYAERLRATNRPAWHALWWGGLALAVLGLVVGIISLFG